MVADQKSVTRRVQVTQQQIWDYARVTGANDPIHVDPEMAKKSRFGGTVAQGLMIFSWLSELMMEIDPHGCVQGGVFEISFRSPARPGDTLDLHCRWTKTIERDGQTYSEYDVRCENQTQAGVVTIISGVARLPVDLTA